MRGREKAKDNTGGKVASNLNTPPKFSPRKCTEFPEQERVFFNIYHAPVLTNLTHP